MTHLISPSELKKHKICYVPGRPPSKIYEYTYGYSMNYYQPMIDYMDRKLVDEETSDQLPHLPWTNERYIEEFDPKKSIKLYTNKEYSDLSKEAEASAKRHIIDYSVKNSYFSAIPTADAARFRQRKPEQSVLEKVSKKDVGKIIDDIKELEMGTYYRYKENMRRLHEEEAETLDTDYPKDLQKAIKGKSAFAISNILLANSMRKVKQSRESNERHARSLSATRYSDRFYHKDEDLLEPKCGLEDIKNEIKEYTQKTEEFLGESRYRLQKMNELLADQDSLVDRALKKKSALRFIDQTKKYTYGKSY